MKTNNIENKCGIYKIVNIVNNKIYIGSSIKTRRRYIAHLNLLNNNKHHNKFLQSSYNKFGSNSFLFSVIEECEIEQLELKEAEYIRLYKSNNRNFGYNIKDPERHTLPKEIRYQIGLKLRGRKHSQETKDKISMSEIGKKLSEETKRKMSIAKKGIKFSSKHIENLRLSHLNHTLSEKSRTKLSESIKLFWIKRKSANPTVNSICV